MPKGLGAVSDLVDGLSDFINARHERCTDVLLALLCMVEGTIRQMPPGAPEIIEELHQQIVKTATILTVTMANMGEKRSN